MTNSSATSKNPIVDDTTDEWRPAGAVVVASLAVLLLGLTAWSAFGQLSRSGNSTLATTQAALLLPAVASAAMLAGAASAVLAVRWLADRFGGIERAWPRAAAATGAGLLAGLLAMGAVVPSYRGDSATAMAITITIAGAAGGALAAVRPVAAIAGGAAGAVAATAVGLLASFFQNDLVDLFGNENTIGSMAAAAGRLQLVISLLSGVVAGLTAFVFLRRTGLSLPWPTYLLAGAVAGLLLVGAWVIARLGGIPVFNAVGDESEFDAAILSDLQAGSFNHGLTVLFTGAVVATLLVGRTLRRPAPSDH